MQKNALTIRIPSLASANGGLASLIYKATGQALLNGDSKRSLCQAVFDDGQERPPPDVECHTQLGPVCGEMRIIGHIGDIRLTNVITLCATLDRVDFDLRVEKPPNDQ